MLLSSAEQSEVIWMGKPYRVIWQSGTVVYSEPGDDKSHTLIINDGMNIDHTIRLANPRGAFRRGQRLHLLQFTRTASKLDLLLFGGADTKGVLINETARETWHLVRVLGIWHKQWPQWAISTALEESAWQLIFA